MKSKFYKINEKMKNGLSNKICKKGFTKKNTGVILFSSLNSNILKEFVNVCG